MLDQIRRLKPYLQANGELATTAEGKIDAFGISATPRTTRQIRTAEQLHCVVVPGEGSCPVYAGGEAFIGPAALITASRFINDSRRYRLLRVWMPSGRRHRSMPVGARCSRECPRGIDVGEEIWQLIAQIKER